MLPRAIHELESSQAAQTRIEMPPGKFHEPLTLGDRLRWRRVDRVMLRRTRSELKKIGEPKRIDPRRAPERNWRRDIWRGDHQTSFLECGGDLPAHSERQVSGIEQQERAYRRDARFRVRECQLVEDARRSP